MLGALKNCTDFWSSACCVPGSTPFRTSSAGYGERFATGPLWPVAYVTSLDVMACGNKYMPIVNLTGS